MKDHLNEFKQKKEENKLSYSAYTNLIYNYHNISNYITGNETISIIIPTHNRFKLLTELITSIFNQTYQNFEIILIDDLSSDETNEAYSNYHDKRLKYYLNYENLGSGLNRQKGYNLSHGDYIIFCDDDDYFIDNNYFFDLINIFKDDNVNIICSESYTHYEKEDKYVYSSINLDEGAIDSIEYLKNFMIKYKKPTSMFPAAFRRKTLIEAEFKEMTMMNDTSVYLRALMMGGNTYINKKIIGIYRIHGENITLNLKADFIIKNLEEKRKIYEYLIEHKTISEIDKWYYKQIDITVNYYLNHDPDEKGMDNVLNWIWKNVSYDEYLKYKKRVIASNNLKLYYFKNWPNFGDLLNEDILSSIFKMDFEFGAFKNADLCCLGSIFDKLITNSNIGEGDKKMQNECEINKPIHIWGTGLMFNYDNVKQIGLRPFIIHALRGEKTRKRLSEILGKDISCVLADPGILAPMLVEPCEKKYSMGIVPHRWDKEEEIFERMLENYPNSRIIDVQNEPKQVLKEISECKYIISTSLHGIIVADSYGIPNCWCEISDRVIGNGFKFHDYFSSFGTDREVFDLRGENLPDIEKDFKCNFKSINQIYEKQKELIECFPFFNIKIGDILKISVIIPLYNVEDYLNECMDSVLKQTHENLEIICINNSSTDNSLNILESYAQKDNRIKVINNQKNYGIGYSRNIGLKYATGDYIFFMDADDIILENTLEKLLENAISNNSDVVLYETCQYNHFTENIRPIKHRLEPVFKNIDFNNFTFNYKDIKEHFLITPTPAWCKFYKKNFLDKHHFGFPEDVAYEDVIFHVKVLLNASKISFLPEHLYLQRLSNPKSQMKDYSKSIDILKVCNDVEQYLIEQNKFKELELEFIIFKINQQRYHFSRLKTKEFQDLIKKEFERMNVEGKENKIPKDLFEFYTDIINRKFFG